MDVYDKTAFQCLGEGSLKLEAERTGHSGREPFLLVTQTLLKQTFASFLPVADDADDALREGVADNVTRSGGQPDIIENGSFM